MAILYFYILGAYSSPKAFKHHLLQEKSMNVPMKTVYKMFQRIPEYNQIVTKRSQVDFRHYSVSRNNCLGEIDICLMPNFGGYKGFLILVDTFWFEFHFYSHLTAVCFMFIALSFHSRCILYGDFTINSWSLK